MRSRLSVRFQLARTEGYTLAPRIFQPKTVYMTTIHEANWLIFAACILRNSTDQNCQVSISESAAGEYVKFRASDADIAEIRNIGMKKCGVDASQQKWLGHPNSKPFHSLRAETCQFVWAGEKGERLTAGGFDEMSYVTRLIPATSFVIRDEIRRRTSGGKENLRKE